MSESTQDLLQRLHGELELLLKALQFALMDKEPGRALEHLRQLRGELGAHMQGEEAVLLPAYQRAVPEPGRGAGHEIFLLEHQKILRMCDGLVERLKEFGSETVGHDVALSLLEAVHPLKHLMHHHEQREERLLAVALDDTLEEQEREELGRALLRAIEGVEP